MRHHLSELALHLVTRTLYFAFNPEIKCIDILNHVKSKHVELGPDSNNIDLTHRTRKNSNIKYLHNMSYSNHDI